MMRLPNTVLSLAPEPAPLTMAAPASMNLAAVSMFLEMVPFWKLLLGISKVRGHGAATLLRLSSVSTTSESGWLCC